MNRRRKEGFVLDNSTWARKRRATSHITNAAVAISNPNPSSNCNNGTGATINRITMTKGEVSGKRLSVTDNAPLGAAIRAVLM